MKATMLAALVTGVVLLAAVKSPVVDACSMPAGWRPLSNEELIQRADNVLFARVRRTFADDQRPWMETIYTAEVDVYCILKGQRSAPVVNITQVGFYPGMCFSTSLSVNDTSVILVGVQDNVYTARRTIPAGWQQLSEFAQICGLQKLYPLGVNQGNSNWICPTPAPPGDCEGSSASDDSDEVTPEY